MIDHRESSGVPHCGFKITKGISLKKKKKEMPMDLRPRDVVRIGICSFNKCPRKWQSKV